MSFKEKDFDILYKKVDSRISADLVNASGDVISLYDLDQAINNVYGKYTNVFDTELSKQIHKMNNKNYFSSILGHKVPQIGRIVPEVTEDGTVYLTVYFVDYYNRVIGSMIINNVRFYMFDVCDLDLNEYNRKDLQNFLISNQAIFSRCLLYAENFAKEYEGIPFKWNDKSKSDYAIQSFDDGFLSIDYDISKAKKRQLIFSKIEDHEISRTWTPKYGEIYELFEFYNDSIKKRTPININDLNPLYRKIVDKYLSYETDMKLTK